MFKKPILVFYLTLLLVTQLPVHAQSPHYWTLAIVFERTSHGWHVYINASLSSGRLLCDGILQPNPYFHETRIIDSDLIVTPLYYVIDTICPKLTGQLPLLASLNDVLVDVKIRVPKGYGLLSLLNIVGQPVRLKLFSSIFIYDGIVIYNTSRFKVVKYDDLVFVVPSSYNYNGLNIMACGVETLREILGFNPRSPKIIVIDTPTTPRLLPPGTGFSLGSVVYVKPSLGSRDYIHIALHEIVHSWIGIGLKASEDLSEGAAELLSMLLSIKCVGQTVWWDSTGVYKSLLKIHLAIRYASLEACGRDLYIEALKNLYQRGGYATLSDLLVEVGKLAYTYGCRSRLAFILGMSLLRSNTSPLYSIGLSLQNHNSMGVRHAPRFQPE